MDPRIEIFAEKLVNYCCSIQRDEKVLISAMESDCYPLVKQIIKEVYKVGAYPYVKLENMTINRELQMGCSKEQMDFAAENDLLFMKGMDAFISIRGFSNVSELSDVPADKTLILMDSNKEVSKERINNTKWVGCRYPNYAIAQLAGMSFEKYEDLYFDICNMDYSKLSNAMDNLVELMESTDKVRIVGKGTDISFSIKGISAIKCDGKVNIPDGEVFTAPIKDSANGYITFNIPSIYQSTTFENIYLKFEDGKIIEATSNYTEKLNDILDIDEGARYLGEFAFGLNPLLKVPTNDGSIDEKISGSIHITPGACYDEASNGNNSKIHWDLVLSQTEEYGGGEIYFDDVLIRKDGNFVLKNLECLNPDNLLSNSNKEEI